jgi:hypothetical protein
VPPHATHQLHPIILQLALHTLQPVRSTHHQARSILPQVQPTHLLPPATAPHHLLIHLLCQDTLPPPPHIHPHLQHMRVMTEMSSCKLSVRMCMYMVNSKERYLTMHITSKTEIKKKINKLYKKYLKHFGLSGTL